MTVDDRGGLVGVFGGTFDPIHNGHVEPVRQLQKRMGLQLVLFLPNAAPPHRSAPVASARHRLAMVKLALAAEPTLRLDDREVKRGGLSYTRDTLRSLQRDYGPNQLCLILGVDAFRGFHTWHLWQEILDIAHIAVMNRPGWPDRSDLPPWCRGRVCSQPEDLLHEGPGRVVFVPVTPRDVSASALRDSIRRGEDVRADVAPAVWIYICEHRLYGAGSRGRVGAKAAPARRAPAQ